ncbi:MAG TPA: GntR family transcriptional regulator, partial [Ramlibacter sp.]
MPEKNVIPLTSARPAALAASQPRYLQLAQTLLREIEAGKYAVGTQLPTEFELCEQFGVSRATAREA